MKLEDVKTWDDYEQYMREKGPEARAEMDKLDRLTKAIVYVMDGLREMEMGIDIYELDEMPERNAEPIPVIA